MKKNVQSPRGMYAINNMNISEDRSLPLFYNQNTPQSSFVCHCLQDQTQDLYPQVDSAVGMLGLSSAVGNIHLILTGDVQLDHLS